MLLKSDIKPCYLPIYDSTIIREPIAIVYMYNNSENEIVVYSNNNSNTLLLKVWYQ